jgi:hypothetical protein
LADYYAATATLHLPGRARNWGGFGITDFNSVRVVGSKDHCQQADSDDDLHDAPPRLVGRSVSALGELSVCSRSNKQQRRGIICALHTIAMAQAARKIAADRQHAAKLRPQARVVGDYCKGDCPVG